MPQNFYATEDVEWTHVDVVTNTPVIELIQSNKRGARSLFSLLNEASSAKHEVKDETLLDNFNKEITCNPRVDSSDSTGRWMVVFDMMESPPT